MTNNKHITFFFVTAQSAILLLWESEIKHMGYKGCMACYSPTATLIFGLLIAWNSFALHGRGSLISTSWTDSDHYRSSTCSGALSQMTPNNFLGNSKSNDASLINRNFLVSSLLKLSAYSFPSILWCPEVHNEVTLLGPLSFSSAYMHSHIKSIQWWF